MRKIQIFAIFLFFTLSSYGFANEGQKMNIEKDRNRHIEYHKNFKTKILRCTDTNSVGFEYDTSKKKFKQDNNIIKPESPFSKFLLKIIKSDDVSTESHCSSKDQVGFTSLGKIPSAEFEEKYFCLIQTHPGMDFETHMKCLLDFEYLDNTPNLQCGNFVYNLKENIYFSWSIPNMTEHHPNFEKLPNYRMDFEAGICNEARELNIKAK